MVHKVGSWMAMGQFEISPFIGHSPYYLLDRASPRISQAVFWSSGKPEVHVPTIM